MFKDQSGIDLVPHIRHQTAERRAFAAHAPVDLPVFDAGLLAKTHLLRQHLSRLLVRQHPAFGHVAMHMRRYPHADSPPAKRLDLVVQRFQPFRRRSLERRESVGMRDARPAHRQAFRPARRGAVWKIPPAVKKQEERVAFVRVELRGPPVLAEKNRLVQVVPLLGHALISGEDGLSRLLSLTKRRSLGDPCAPVVGGRGRRAQGTRLKLARCQRAERDTEDHSCRDLSSFLQMFIRHSS